MTQISSPQHHHHQNLLTQACYLFFCSRAMLVVQAPSRRDNSKKQTLSIMLVDGWSVVQLKAGEDAEPQWRSYGGDILNICNTEEFSRWGSANLQSMAGKMHTSPFSKYIITWWFSDLFKPCSWSQAQWSGHHLGNIVSSQYVWCIFITWQLHESVQFPIHVPISSTSYSHTCKCHGAFLISLHCYLRQETVKVTKIRQCDTACTLTHGKQTVI